MREGGAHRGGFPFPRGLETGGCGGRQDLCYVNKANHASCRGAGAIDALGSIAETKHGSWRRRKRRRTREEQGGWGVCVRVLGDGGGVTEEEPFPSQLRLRFLSVKEVPCWCAR